MALYVAAVLLLLPLIYILVGPYEVVTAYPGGGLLLLVPPLLFMAVQFVLAGWSPRLAAALSRLLAVVLTFPYGPVFYRLWRLEHFQEDRFSLRFITMEFRRLWSEKELLGWSSAEALRHPNRWSPPREQLEQLASTADSSMDRFRAGYADLLEAHRNQRPPFFDRNPLAQLADNFEVALGSVVQWVGEHPKAVAFCVCWAVGVFIVYWLMPPAGGVPPPPPPVVAVPPTGPVTAAVNEVATAALGGVAAAMAASLAPPPSLVPPPPDPRLALVARLSDPSPQSRRALGLHFSRLAARSIAFNRLGRADLLTLEERVEFAFRGVRALERLIFVAGPGGAGLDALTELFPDMPTVAEFGVLRLPPEEAGLAPGDRATVQEVERLDREQLEAQRAEEEALLRRKLFPPSQEGPPSGNGTGRPR
jgi:hypothetical protein